MKLKRTSFALATAGALLATGASAATLVCDDDPRFASAVTCVSMSQDFVSHSEPMLITARPVEPTYEMTYYIVEPARVTYYLTVSQNLLPNPSAPSESNSWGG